jgi:hypothetical protein
MEYSVRKVEHLWCEDDDRWVYIEYNENGEILGLNFMQCDDYFNFLDGWCKCDDGLTEYYTHMVDVFKIEKQSSNKLGFINKVMWSYHLARSMEIKR